jgi:SAM-dependent methyltransferase
MRTDRAIEEHPNTRALRWYQAVYRLFYRLGLWIVWKRAAPPAELVALVEGPCALPAGRALDLGCGSGTDTIYVATHGWDVTGVDITPRALALARRNGAAAGVAPRFIHGDVTRLEDLDVGDGYMLLVDFGCFHTLPDDRRSAYVAGVSRAAAPGATLLLVGFCKVPKAVPVHAGMTVDEVRQRFVSTGWELVNAERSVPETRAPRRLRDRFEFWSYQLRRNPS